MDALVRSEIRELATTRWSEVVAVSIVVMAPMFTLLAVRRPA
jgi:hypothetical protein